MPYPHITRPSLLRARSPRSTRSPALGRGRRLMMLGIGGAIIAAQGCSRQPDASLRPSGQGSAVSQAADPAPVSFVNATANSGIHSIYRNGEEAGIRSIVESLGGGLGVLDYDSDGRDDLFFPGGGTFIPDQPLPGHPATLWRNLGQMKFAPVATASGIDQPGSYSHGCAMADYDADGYPDVLVTGYGGVQLFHNNGDGTFEELARSSGLVNDSWSSSAAWGDFNNDGLADVYVTNYVDWSWEKNPQCTAPHASEREICSPQDFDPLLDTIYFNNGDGTFREGGPASGIDVAGKGLGVVAVDVDGDSLLDIYVANDTTNNLLFMNQGEGKFEEMGVVSGVAFDERGVANGSMGLAVLDYDNDLRPDIWVTNYENETFALYHNDSAGMFRCLTQSTGITAIGTLYVGFGTVAADFDRSGSEDLVVSNGHVMLYPSSSPIAQQPLFIVNDGEGKLRRVEFAPDDYFSQGHRGRGVVATDLDGDGRMDLAFSHVNEPAAILRQTTDLTGDSMRMKLVGTTSNRDAIGSRVVVETENRKLMRTIVGGGSYLSQNPYTVEFGIPAGEAVQSVQITWPDGTTSEPTELSTGTTNLVVQPQPVL